MVAPEATLIWPLNPVAFKPPVGVLAMPISTLPGLNRLFKSLILPLPPGFKFSVPPVGTVMEPVVLDVPTLML